MQLCNHFLCTCIVSYAYIQLYVERNSSQRIATKTALGSRESVCGGLKDAWKAHLGKFLSMEHLRQRLGRQEDDRHAVAVEASADILTGFGWDWTNMGAGIV